MKINRKLHSIIAIISLSLISYTASAKLYVPDIASVSVNPLTNIVTVKYYESISAEAISLEIQHVFQTSPIYKASVLHSISNNTAGSVELDLANLPNYSDRDYTRPIRLTMLAFDALGNNSDTLAQTHSSIYLDSDFDLCSKSAKLSWNLYEGYDCDILSTAIYSISPSGVKSLFQKISALSENADIPVNYGDVGKCYYIQCEIIDSHNQLQTVTSNKSCPIAKFPQGPRFMNADYATSLSDSTLEVSFTIDTKSEITEFRLWHSTSKKGPFEVIDTAILGQAVHPFIFTLTDSMLAKQRNFFMLVAYDSCGDSILASNMASNIVLELKNDQLSNELLWNEYYKWQGSLEDYYIMRSIDGGEYSTVSSRKQYSEYIGYNDYLGEMLYNNGEFCYYIEAREQDNPHIPDTKNGISRSNTVCIVMDARIFIPSSFNPLSAVVANREFMPQGCFFNIDKYHFVVWNRYDEIMFESDKYGESWDGMHRDKAVPEGVYMYKLNVGHHSGDIVKKGTVSVVYKEKK